MAYQPVLERGQNGQAMLLSKPPDAVGPALTRAERSLLRLRLDLVEALEELQGLIRQPAVAPARPDRWSGRTRNWQPIGAVWLNPERPEAGRRGHGAADALPHEAGGGGPMAGPANRAA